MNKIVECVPNFSEGTDPSLIENIVSAVKSAKVINLHSDPDHNRSVATIVGEPEAVKLAAIELTERAMQLLDVKGHAGAHPFIGVVDVIPFIPIAGCTVAEVCQLAHKCGMELWQKLKLPVYFYGEAARLPERMDLPNVRRGGYHLLSREIDRPERKPDVGKGLHATAGAAAVGVRDFLIAFNVALATNELDIAKSIAKNIREKDGGLTGIRALGLGLKSRGITQVSINITDQRMTSLQKVFDEVKRWAKEYQVELLHSELVGLIPKEAYFPGIKEYLMLPSFSDNLILENHLGKL